MHYENQAGAPHVLWAVPAIAFVMGMGDQVLGSVRQAVHLSAASAVAHICSSAEAHMLNALKVCLHAHQALLVSRLVRLLLWDGSDQPAIFKA